MENRTNSLIFVMSVVVGLSGMLLGCSQDLATEKERSGANSSSSTSSGTKSIDNQISHVIYGEDDRKEIYEAPSEEHKEVARSTAILVQDQDLTYDSTTMTYSHDSMTFGESQLLCSDVRFYEQYSLGYCSGFLIAPDLVLTAGHCFSDEEDCLSSANYASCVQNLNNCDNTRFVFDFALLQSESDSQGPKSFPESDVYKCKELLYDKDVEYAQIGKQWIETSSSDFAIVRLDRSVENRSPLKLNRAEEAKVKDEVFVVGHPSGIPSKITDNAEVRSVGSEIYYLNSDTYGGNSGSAVFSEGTFRVEGILVSGETDFAQKPGFACYVSNRCEEDGCTGEGVTKIQQILSHISDEFDLAEPDFDEIDGRVYFEYEEGYKCKNSKGRKIKSYKSKIKFVTKNGEPKTIFFGDKCQSSKDKQSESFNSEDFDFSNDLSSVTYRDGRVFEK